MTSISTQSWAAPVVDASSLRPASRLIKGRQAKFLILLYPAVTRVTGSLAWGGIFFWTWNL